ncbi:outer membrane protein assembly factor BamA [Rhodobacteraceae bacterium IMCC15231]|nr:outer membrane protein assembly factor BamA [Rhodobacteraceae bacterium IMCC15231]
MKRFFGIFIAAIISIGSTVWAQEFNFSSIEVDGNRRIETSTIIRYANLSIGKTVLASEISAAYQELADSGLFEDIEFIPQGRRLIIKVQEYPTISKVAFEGNDKLQDDVLAQIVSAKSRRVFNPMKVEEDKERIAQAYADMGRLASRVTPKIIRLPDNRVNLVFEIFEGGVVEIERIGFVGNKSYSDRKLRNVLNTKQAGLLRLLVQRDTFIEDRIEFDKQVLTDFYQSRGFVDFVINGVNAEFSEERDGYFITFNIQEGQQFDVGAVILVSERSDVDEMVFSEALTLKPSVIYSPLAVEDDIARLERLAVMEGVDFLRVTPRLKRNDTTRTLDVTFVLDRGKRIFIERINVSGNTSTLDNVIRRQFRAVEGDPFNPRALRAAVDRIRRLGFFDPVNVSTRSGNKPETVIIDLAVGEKPTGSLSLGAGYSTALGLGGIIEYRERNFIGRGQGLNFKIQGGSDNTTYSFGFIEPAFLGNELQFSLNLAYEETNQQNSTYDTKSVNFQPGISYPISDFSRLGFRYSYTSDKVSGEDVSSIIGDEIKQQGRVNASGMGYTFGYDTRRVGLNPTAGVLLQFSQDFTGLGGDTTSVKSNLKLQGEQKTLGEEVTLSATFEAGDLRYSRGQSRVSDRFALGSRVMRGFNPGGVGPRERSSDGSGTINDALGGEQFAVARFEAEFPIGIPEEYGITGGVFFDAGSLWGLPVETSPDSANTVYYNAAILRQVVGAAVFWATPIGPLRFNWTRAIQKEEFDEANNFEFTLSTRF